MNGVPSPLQYVGGASVPPGDYIFKLAVAEGDRVGTIEHAIPRRAERGGRDQAERSDGRRTGGRRAICCSRPSATWCRSAACTATSKRTDRVWRRLTARYEIAASAHVRGARRSRRGCASRSAAPRAIFSDVLLTRQLPPGTLRAPGDRVVSADATAKTLTQNLRSAAPPVLMTSAGGLGLSAVR